MVEFNRNMNGRSLSPSASWANSRRSSANQEEAVRFNYASPQQSRRQSASPGMASTFRARSPSDPQNYGDEHPSFSRRYSQPASPASYRGTYADQPSPSLVRQERKSYSSLNHLPEIRTYLQFMEDSTVLPQRSKSFNGRNSSRRSSYNRRRPHSRPRTPILIPDEVEPALHRVGSGSSAHYGHYLTPRPASLEQTSSKHLDYDQGNDADVEDGDVDPQPKPKQKLSDYNARIEGRMASGVPPPLYTESFLHRRSSIKTTFI